MSPIADFCQKNAAVFLTAGAMCSSLFRFVYRGFTKRTTVKPPLFLQLTSEKIVLDTHAHESRIGLFMAKKTTKVNMTWTPTVEDRKLMAELRARTGVRADSEVLRLSLRALARNLNIDDLTGDAA